MGILNALALEFSKGVFMDLNVMSAVPDLIALARLVAKDYEDAADWKDARGELASMARAALDKAGVDYQEEEDDSDWEDAVIASQDGAFQAYR